MDYQNYRIQAFKHWETRRIIWNFLLALISIPSYYLFSDFGASFSSAPKFEITGVVLHFITSAIGANICFTFVYALEFNFAFGKHHDSYLKVGRKLAFLAGCILGIILAVLGGRSIAFLQYGLL